MFMIMKLLINNIILLLTFSFQIAVEMKLVVSLPDYTNIKSVCVMGINSSLKKTRLKLQDTGVYATTINVGPKIHGKFKYAVQFEKHLIKFWQPEFEYSNPYTFQNVEVQREIFGETSNSSLQSGFIMHLNDILQCHALYSFESICLQIEHICCFLDNMTCDKVLEYILNHINHEQHGNNIILALAIGYVCRHNSKLLKHNITLEKVNILSSTLLSCHLDKMPTICHTTIVLACKVFCEIAHPAHFSLCFFINEYFTFLGEQRVETELNSWFKNNYTDICLENDNSPDDLFQRLIDDKSLKMAKELKVTLLKKLPVKVSMQLFKTYYSVLKEDDQILQLCKSICFDALQWARNVANLKYLLELAILIEETSFIKDAGLKQQIEQCVIKVIQWTCVDNDIEDLFLSFLKKDHFFVTNDLKCVLLKTLAKSENRCLSNIVLRLMDNQSFRIPFESRHDQVCLTWLKNYIHCEMIDKKFCDLLLIIFRGASALLKHDIRIEIEKDILNYVYEKAKKESVIADFFKVIDEVENVLKSHTEKRKFGVLQKLFVNTFYLKLTDNTTKKPEELLRLCLTEGSYTISAGYVFNTNCTMLNKL